MLSGQQHVLLQKKLPILSNMRTKLQENICNTDKNHMKKLAFAYKKSKTNRKLLMERLTLHIQVDSRSTCTATTVSKTWQDGDIVAMSVMVDTLYPFIMGKV